MLKKELEKENRKLRSELKKEKAQADSFKQAMGRLNVRLADQAQEINVFKKETGKLDKVLAEIKRIALYLSTTQGMKGGYKNLLDNIVSLVSEKNKYKGMASTLQLKLNNWEREACGYLGRIVKDPAKAFLDIYDRSESVV